MQSPLNSPDGQQQYLPLLLDKTTTNTTMELTPRININTAPPAVVTALQAVAQLSDQDVQNILGTRPALGTTPDATFQTPALLINQAGLSPATAKRLSTYVTTQSQVYRMQALGYFDKPGPTARVEAVVDTNQGRPRIVYWRNLTELGKSFDPTQMGQ
jgi:hypothetical protein